MVVGHGAQRTARSGLLEEDAEQRHQRGSNQCGVPVFLVNQNAAFKRALQNHHRVFGHTDVNLVNTASENGLAQAFQKVGNAQGCHQQGGAFLVDQMAQHQTLNHPGDHKHHHTRADEGHHIGGDRVANAQVQGNPLRKTRHRQSCKQHHGTLRKVEHAGCLVRSAQSPAPPGNTTCRPSGRRARFQGKNAISVCP